MLGTLAPLGLPDHAGRGMCLLRKEEMATMSKRGKMLKSRRTTTTPRVMHDGCSCCNTKNQRRKPMRAQRLWEKRFWKKDVEND